MDTMDIQTATVVGTARSDSWSQVQSFSTPKGHMLVMVSLRYAGDSELIDLASMGSGLLESIRLSSHFVPDNFDSDADEISLSLLIVRFHDTTVSIEGQGGVELYILRDGKMGRLFTGSPALTSLDGSFVPGDMFLAATSETIQSLGISQIRQFMEMRLSAAEDLAVHIRGTSHSSTMAAALISAATQPTLTTPRATEPDTASRLPFLSQLRSLWGRVVVRLGSPKPLFIAPEKRAKNLWIGSVLLVLLFVGIVVGAIRRSTLLKQPAHRGVSSHRQAIPPWQS